MTTMPAIDPYAVRDQAVHEWLMHATTHRYDARLTTWTHSVNAAGEPVWSAELAGADVELALPRFASTTRLPLRADSDVLPGLSVELEGRVAVWWRQGGVWVELWHADPLPPAVTPIGGLWRRTVEVLPKPGPNLFPQRHPACTCSPPDRSESAGPQYPDEDCPEHGNPDVLALPKIPTQLAGRSGVAE